MTCLLILIAFACGCLLDIVWTLCIHAVAQHRAVFAANLGALLYLCTILSTVLIIERCIIGVVAYLIGGWLGTYFTVRLSRVRTN